MKYIMRGIKVLNTSNLKDTILKRKIARSSKDISDK